MDSEVMDVNIKPVSEIFHYIFLKLLKNIYIQAQTKKLII